MDTSCLQYRLSDEERRTFEQTGLLQIENALAGEQIAALTSTVDRILAAKVSAGHDPHKALFYPNYIPDDPSFADLVDYRRVLPKVGASWAGTSIFTTRT